MKKEKTLQWVFSKVYRHMLKQGEKAVDMIGDCQYRGRDGTMCAVGCLINDTHYKEEFEGKAVTDKKVRLALKKSLGRTGKLPELWGNVLYALQDVHDNIPECRWKIELEAVAKKFNLTVPKGVMNRCPQ